eukprot:391795-Amphidinium_carterae.1
MSLAWVLSFKESDLSGINTWLAPLDDGRAHCLHVTDAEVSRTNSNLSAHLLPHQSKLEVHARRGLQDL